MLISFDTKYQKNKQKNTRKHIKRFVNETIEEFTLGESNIVTIHFTDVEPYDDNLDDVYTDQDGRIVLDFNQYSSVLSPNTNIRMANVIGAKRRLKSIMLHEILLYSNLEKHLKLYDVIDEEIESEVLNKGTKFILNNLLATRGSYQYYPEIFFIV